MKLPAFCLRITPALINIGPKVKTDRHKAEIFLLKVGPMEVIYLLFIFTLLYPKNDSDSTLVSIIVISHKQALIISNR